MAILSLFGIAAAWFFGYLGFCLVLRTILHKQLLRDVEKEAPHAKELIEEIGAEHYVMGHLDPEASIACARYLKTYRFLGFFDKVVFCTWPALLFGVWGYEFSKLTIFVFLLPVAFFGRYALGLFSLACVWWFLQN